MGSIPLDQLIGGLVRSPTFLCLCGHEVGDPNAGSFKRQLSTDAKDSNVGYLPLGQARLVHSYNYHISD